MKCHQNIRIQILILQVKWLKRSRKVNSVPLHIGRNITGINGMERTCTDKKLCKRSLPAPQWTKNTNNQCQQQKVLGLWKKKHDERWIIKYPTTTVSVISSLWRNQQKLPHVRWWRFKILRAALTGQKPFGLKGVKRSVGLKLVSTIHWQFCNHFY